MRGMADVRVQRQESWNLTRDGRSQGSAKLGASEGGTVIGSVREYVYCDGCLGRRLLRAAWMAGSDGMWCCGVLALNGSRQPADRQRLRRLCLIFSAVCHNQNSIEILATAKNTTLKSTAILS